MYVFGMLSEFIRKLEKSKWLPWIGVLPLIVLPLAFVDEQPAQTAGIIAVIASAFAGIFLGGTAARIICSGLRKTTENQIARLSAGCAVFGFLLLPALIATFANTYLGTGITMLSLGKHVMLASTIAVFAYLINPLAE